MSKNIPIRKLTESPSGVSGSSYAPTWPQWDRGHDLPARPWTLKGECRASSHPPPTPPPPRQWAGVPAGPEGRHAGDRRWSRKDDGAGSGGERLREAEHQVEDGKFWAWGETATGKTSGSSGANQWTTSGLGQPAASFNSLHWSPLPRMPLFWPAT